MYLKFSFDSSSFVITIRFLRSLEKHSDIFFNKAHSHHACPISETHKVQQSALSLHDYSTVLSPQQFRLIAQSSE